MRWKLVFVALLLIAGAVAAQFAPNLRFFGGAQLMQTLRGWGGVVALVIAFGFSIASFFASRDDAPSLLHKLAAAASVLVSLGLLTLLLKSLA